MDEEDEVFFDEEEEEEEYEEEDTKEEEEEQEQEEEEEEEEEESRKIPSKRQIEKKQNEKLFEMILSYTSFPSLFPSRRSLFHDEDWIRERTRINAMKATTVEKWSFYSHVRFTQSNLIITNKDSNERTVLLPYLIRFPENEVDDDLDAPLPMPKKRRGKKAAGLPSDEEYKDVMHTCQENVFYLHAGGTVNGIHFHDCYHIDQKSRTCTQYFAVATSGIGWPGDHSSPTIPSHLTDIGVGYDYPHEVANSITSTSLTPNFLQIYSIVTSFDQSSSSPKFRESQLVYCIAFSSIGPILDVKWCPEDQNYKQLSHSESILGTIAVISGDGKCRVLVLPTPEAVKESGDSFYPEPSPEYYIPDSIRNVPLLSEIDLCRWELCLPESILSISWGGGTSNNGEDGVSPLYLACGLSSGSIAIWDLSISAQRHSLLEKSHSGSEFDSTLIFSSVPLFRFIDLNVRVGSTFKSNSRPVVCGVRAVSFCPYNGDLLASGGYDGGIKIWHIDDKFRPIYCRDEATWIYALDWNIQGFGISWGSAGHPIAYYDQLWAHENQSVGSRFTTHSHPSLYSGINKILHIPCINSRAHLSCSVASDGTLVGSCYPLRRPKRKIEITQFFRLHEVTMIEEMDEETGEIMRNAELLMTTKLSDALPDTPSSISPTPVALLALSSVELPRLASVSKKKHQNSDAMTTDYRLMGYGGQAGFVRIQLIHPLCFHHRIQLFQDIK